MQLFISTGKWEKDNKTIQVWRMQEKCSWVREFIIRDISYKWRYLEFIKTFEDREILFLINKDFYTSTIL